MNLIYTTVRSAKRKKLTITVERETWMPPESFALGEAALKPLRAGEALHWRVRA
jgi:dihydroorotase